MKSLVFCCPILILLLVGCKKSKSTNTSSEEFGTLSERKEFLEQYVSFRRGYDELHFNLNFMDGSTGMVPGPTEWDIRIFAIVPEEEIELWSEGLAECGEPELSWTSAIPSAPTDYSQYVWYEGAKVTVGVKPRSRAIVYWNRVY